MLSENESKSCVEAFNGTGSKTNRRPEMAVSHRIVGCDGQNCKGFMTQYSLIARSLREQILANECIILRRRSLISPTLSTLVGEQLSTVWFRKDAGAH